MIGKSKSYGLCASSEALAVLELRVHLGRYIPRDRYIMHEIDVSDECIAERASQTLTGVRDFSIASIAASTDSTMRNSAVDCQQRRPIFR